MGDIISLMREVPIITSRTTSSAVMPRCSAWASIWFKARGVLTKPVLTVKQRIYPSPSAEMDWLRARRPNLVMLYTGLLSVQRWA